MKLFRPEALDHHRRRLLGDVIIMQPVGLTAVTTLLCTIVLAGGLFFFFDGVHALGLVRSPMTQSAVTIFISSDTTGMIEKIHVDRGDVVNRGDRLVTIRVRSAE